MGKRIKNEYKELYLSEEYIEKNWTWKRLIKEGELPPIYIKSHYRPDAPALNQFIGYKGKKHIVVYSNQEEEYKKWIEHGYELILIDSEKNHVSINTNEAIRHADRNQYKYILILDDDIKDLYIGVEGKTAKGDYCTFKKPIDINVLAATWLNELKRYEDSKKLKWGLSGIIHANSAQWVDLNDKTKNEIKHDGLIMQFYMVNVKELISNDLMFTVGDTWEDFDMSLKLMSNGFHTPVVPWLSYSCENMNENNSQLDSHDNVYQKNVKLSLGLYNTWGPNYTSLRVIRDLPNARIKWQRAKKDFGNFNIGEFEKENENIFKEITEGKNKEDTPKVSNDKELSKEIINNMSKEILLNTYLEKYSLFNRETKEHCPGPSTLMKPLTHDLYKDIPEYILEAAREKGELIHNAIENTFIYETPIKPMDIEGNKKVEPYWNAFEKFYNEKTIEPYGAEVRIWNKKDNLSGIIDFIGKVDNENYIIDWKTTAKLNMHTSSIQLYFYKKALESFDIHIDKLAICWLKKDGTYELVEVEEKMFPIYEKIYESLVAIHDYRKLKND